MSRKYSIFLPVHNGGEHVRQCVAAVLAQRLGDFDFVVLENGSTDGTREFLAGLRDPRITIRPSDTLLPIEANWGRVLDQPKNEFMTIIGHDDLLDPNYLEVMDGLVRREPNAGLYFTNFRFIDCEGGKLNSCRPLPTHETAAEYLAAILSFQRDSHGSGYLYRSNRYEAVGGMPRWPHLLFADEALWMLLMEGAGKVTAPEECFSVRLHRKSYSRAADPQWLANAMETYMDFLRNMAKRDPELQPVLSQYAPAFFLKFLDSLYERLMLEASDHNRRVDQRRVEDLAGIARRIIPERQHLFKGCGGRFSRRGFFNRFACTRWMYHHYRVMRYGRTAH